MGHVALRNVGKLPARDINSTVYLNRDVVCPGSAADDSIGYRARCAFPARPPVKLLGFRFDKGGARVPPRGRVSGSLAALEPDNCTLIHNRHDNQRHCRDKLEIGRTRAQFHQLHDIAVR